MTRALVRPGVMAQAVVDHPSKSGLARPDNWVKPAIGELFTHHRDVGVGVEIAVTLVENGEVRHAMDNWMDCGVHDNGEQILFRMHGATWNPMSAEHLGPPGHGDHRCGADMHAEKRTASLEMAIESPLRGIDAGPRSSLARVSDVDDNQVGLTRVGQGLFDGVADRHLMAELGDNLGQAL